MHLSSSQWPTICAKDFSDSWNITWSNELWLYYAERNQFLWPLILISKSTSEEALGTELPSRANFTKDSQRISSFYPCRCHLPAWMSGCSFLQRSLLCLPLLHWHQPPTLLVTSCPYNLSYTRPLYGGLPHKKQEKENGQSRGNPHPWLGFADLPPEMYTGRCSVLAFVRDLLLC